jgi:HK97 family phage major capsid protein
MSTNAAGRVALDKLAMEIRGIVNSVERRGSKTLNSSERERYDRLVAQWDRQCAALEASEGRALTDPAPGPRISDFSLEELRDTLMSRPGARRDVTPEGKAFTNYLRRGLDGLDADDRQIMRNRFQNLGGIRNAQTTTPGTGGGYLIPTGFSEKLQVAMKWFGGIDGVVGEITTESGNPMPYPTVNDTTNYGRIIGQNVQLTETDFVFNQITFNAYILSSDLVLIPLSLVEDSFFDIDALAAKLLGTRLGRLLNNMCTIGTGTAQPTGIVTAAVAEGNVITLASGNTASIAYANLVALESAVDPSYRYNPSTRWMFSDAMLKLLKLLVDGQSRPLWQPGLTASFETGASVNLLDSKPKILDHPYIINQDMAAPAANAYSMLFGDVSNYILRKVGTPTVLRLVERYADYLQVGLTAFFRVDGQLVDAGTHPIAVMQQSAT